MSFSDRFFSYETFKVLRVRDRRLGGLYRLFQITILLYIASSIIYQQRYLKTENVINGAVRVTLKAPVDGLTTPGYCKAPTVPTAAQPSLPGSTPPCLYWGSNDILYEPGVDGALVTTRASITQYGPFNNETTNPNKCDVNVPIVAGCSPHSAPTTLLLPTSLVADIERFTLMLEHSIRGQATGLQIRSGNMESGLLRDSASGEVLKTFTDQSRYVPESIASTTTTIVKNSSDTTVTASATAKMESGKMVHLAGDVMTVGEFLKAAGVNLEDISTSPSASVNETVRSSGIVVIVVIQYAAKGWNPNKISYEYLPKAIPDQEYKVIETIRDFRGGNRVEINRHGIRIVFSQAGQLGQFSLMTLLTNLVAAVALFKVANIVVELMMLRLHPQKKIYTRAKFEHAKDGVPVQRPDGAGNSSTAGLEELTAGEEESQTGSDSGFRERRIQDGRTDSGTATPGSSTSVSGSGNTTERSGAERFARHGGGGGRMDEEAASRNHQGESDDYSTDSDDSNDSDDSDESDTDVKGNRRRSHVQDTAQSSSVDPTRLQLRVEVSRQSSRGPTGFGSKDSYHSATTPISTNGTVGRQHGSQLTKAAGMSSMTPTTAMSGVDWNRNGSSSALSGGDVTPGVARATTAIRPSGGSVYGLAQGYGAVTPRDSTEEIEIETRFGPLRLNEYKGFNPGGLSLTGTPPLSPSPSQARYAFGSMRRGSATPERSAAYGVSTPSPTRSGSGEAFSAFRSPATMQAASPSPVFFGHHQHYYGSNIGRRESVVEDSGHDKGSRSKKQHPFIQKSTGLVSPTSPLEITRTLKSRHSSGSMSSLSSSSSSSSLASLYESDQQRGGSAATSTTMGFGLGHAGAGVGGARCSTSAWSCGLPGSSLHGECSGGDTFIGSTTRSPATTARHCSSKEKSHTAGGREHKKRRKEYSQATATISRGRGEGLLQSSKSEVILTRPMFGLGSASNMSSFSLSLASSSAVELTNKDVKGKHVESRWSVQEGSSTSTPTITPSPITTSAFNVSMTPFQLPMPAYFSQGGLGSKLDLEDALADFSTSSASTTKTTSTSSGKQVQRGASLRHTLRSSVSSPSLLTGHRDARSAVAAGSGLPVRAQVASHSDLPPKSVSVEPSLVSSSSSLPSSSESLFGVTDGSSGSSGAFMQQSQSGELSGSGTRSVSAGSIGHFALATQQHQQVEQASVQESTATSVSASYNGLQGSAPILFSAVSHFSGSSPFATSDASFPAATTTTTTSSSGFSLNRSSIDYPVTRTPSSTSTTHAVPLPLRPILSSSSHLQSYSLTSTSAPATALPYTLINSTSGSEISPLSSTAQSFTPPTTSAPILPTSTSSPARSSAPQQYYTHPTSTYFTSPITSSCTTTMPDTGVRILGPTITMITADNRKLVLRRSAPLILNEGVGEEKAARM
ncbi:cytochrome c oxidase subunit 1 [Linnemannia exigua]|uniref:Cytochrome c oxidase subunit 1 n=1 Tax=Linnemannia exigua TaxID=604196 RepID=A0AAD4D950_9FUNG|nr:cytochrome c oxidase subunit 1 [Linnemannia exigua]